MAISPQQLNSEASVCPSCGAGLVFNPKVGKLSCPYCDGTKTVIGGANGIEEQALAGQWQIAPQSSLSMQALEVECSGCRAQITFEPPDVAGDCPFCGTHIAAQPQTADPVITPGGILPFKVGRKEGRQKLMAWLSSRWFAPTSLKQLAQHEALTGVYLPFWTFDADTQTRYTGKRGDYYYVTKTRRVQNSAGEWQTENYQERHTRWRAASGTVRRTFDDLLIPAIASIDQTRLDNLGPWPLSQLVAYDPSYLRGFRAQRYQVALNDGYSSAKALMRPEIDSAIRSDIGGDEQQINTRDTAYHDETFKHILLPVWIATYRFKNKPYQVMLNGENGKIVGDRPYSPLKIAGAVTGVLVAIAMLWGGYTYSQGDWQLPWQTNSTTSLPTSPLPTASPTTMDPPVEMPVPVTTLNPSAAFDQALSLGYEAATKNQTAQSKQDWQEVSSLWAAAIDTLKQVPETDPNAAIAQQKIQDYQRNLNYARAQLSKIP